MTPRDADDQLAERVRGAMEREAAGRAPDALLVDTMAEIREAASRHRARHGDGWAWSRPVAMAGLAGALAIGVALGFVLGQWLTGARANLGGERSAPPSPAAQVLPTRAVEARLPYPGRAISVAADGVWLAGGPGYGDSRDGLVRRIDPETYEERARSELAAPVTAMADDDDGVWVLAPDAMELARLAADGAIQRRLPAGDGVLAAGDGEVWLASGGDLLHAAPGSSELTPAARYAGIETDMVVVDGSVWLATTRGILHIDGVTGEAVTIAESTGGQLAAGDGSVWAATSTEILRIDPVSAAVTARMPAVRGLIDVAWAGSRLWGVGPPEAEEPSYVYEFDPAVYEFDPAADGLVSQTPLGAGASAIAAGRDSVWASEAGSVGIARLLIDDAP
jgi:hypothetical protein